MSSGASERVMNQLDPTDYLNDRVAQYRRWYDRKARRCKSWHLGLHTVGLAAAAVLPALIVAGGVAKWPAAGASLVVLFALGLDLILRLRDQWENYRYTEQYLDRERYLFSTGAGVYRQLSLEEAFLLFVERVEWAIAAENSTTLATMALSPDAGVRPNSSAGRSG